jgi:PAS domain S-box-containing protein
VAHQDAARNELGSAHSWKGPDPAESQPVGTLHCTADGTRWLWSQSVAKLYGYPEAEQPSLELLLQHTHLEDRTRVAADFHRMLRGQSVSSRYRVIDHAGGQHWVVLVSDQSDTRSENVFRASGYLLDVTEAVQAGVTAAVSEMAGSRAVIEQAKGVLIAAHGISADEAFDRLVRRSQEANIKLKDIASQVLAAISGKLPATGVPLP